MMMRVSKEQENIDESDIYIDGVNDNVTKKILEAFGFSLGTLPFRYLGVPLVS